MQLTLEKGPRKSTPFLGGILEFQVGHLYNETRRKIFRYTRSMKTFRSYFRVTLQYEGDEEHTPYVFDVVKRENESNVEIKPESEDAKKIWSLPASPPYQELTAAIAAVYAQDIENP